jgi:hypothetical protein
MIELDDVFVQLDIGDTGTVNHRIAIDQRVMGGVSHSRLRHYPGATPTSRAAVVHGLTWAHDRCSNYQRE